MKLTTKILLLFSHLGIGVFGFMLGMYMLPILIAPEPPSASEISRMSANASYTASFIRELEDSDSLHWGEGKVAVGPKFITLEGELAPGPDYKLYLATEFVETEADFKRLKNTMALVGDVNTFNNFSVDVPQSIDVSQYNSVIVWCESFGQFITAAQYR